MSKRRQWAIVGALLIVITIVAVIWLASVGDDFDCTADRQDAIETERTPPDCE